MHGSLAPRRRTRRSRHQHLAASRVGIAVYRPKLCPGVRMAFRPERSTVVVPQRLVKSSRKSAAPAPAPGPTPQQLELERLTTENARLSLAQTEASEGLAAAQEDLLAAQKREASLSDLMSSAGCDTVTLGPLLWSIDSAQQLLDDEVATRAALQVRALPPARNPRPPPFICVLLLDSLLNPHLDARRSCSSESVAGVPAPKSSSRRNPSCSSSCRHARRWRRTETAPLSEMVGECTPRVVSLRMVCG